MNTVMARYNAGRWVVDCPSHKWLGCVAAYDYRKEDPSQSPYWTAGMKYICPVCYPGTIATIKGGFDVKAQAAARAEAEKDGKVYRVVFPPNRAEIEVSLSDKPKAEQNWQADKPKNEQNRQAEEV